MDSINVRETAIHGMYLGLGVAIVPAVATAAIASSKIILINVIADIALRILTVGKIFTFDLWCFI